VVASSVRPYCSMSRTATLSSSIGSPIFQMQELDRVLSPPAGAAKEARRAKGSSPEPRDRANPLAHAKGPDIVVTFPGARRQPIWSEGADSGQRTARATGPLSRFRAIRKHEPVDREQTFIAWGTDFKRAATIRTPVSNGEKRLHSRSHRVRPRRRAARFEERHRPRPSRRTGRGAGAEAETTNVTATPDGRYRVAIQVSEVGAQRYIDKSWRMNYGGPLSSPQCTKGRRGCSRVTKLGGEDPCSQSHPYGKIGLPGRRRRPFRGLL